MHSAYYRKLFTTSNIRLYGAVGCIKGLTTVRYSQLRIEGCTVQWVASRGLLPYVIHNFEYEVVRCSGLHQGAFYRTLFTTMIQSTSKYILLGLLSPEESGYWDRGICYTVVDLEILNQQTLVRKMHPRNSLRVNSSIHHLYSRYFFRFFTHLSQSYDSNGCSGVSTQSP